MGLSSAIVRRSLPRIGEYVSRADGIRSWIEGGSFYIDDQSTDSRILLKNITITEILPYFMFDYERFALSCWESFSVYKEESNSHNLLAWPFLKLYYSAFFGAHAAMRVVGEGVIRIEHGQAKRLSELVSIFMAPGFLVGTGTYHVRTIQNTDLTINVFLQKLSDTGGAHDGFWRVFSGFLQEIEAESIRGRYVDAALIVSKIEDITKITKAYGGAAGNWLSTIRNRINYSHDFGVWFPIKGSHASLDDLRGIVFRNLDGIRLDINPGKEPLRAFAAASQVLASLSFEIAEQIAAQSDAATRFGSKWKRLRRELRDGEPARPG